ncbi:MAG: lysylphosphatidylglycerol synthase domain-containing protein [Gammaproteobacteria bacterium]
MRHDDDPNEASPAVKKALYLSTLAGLLLTIALLISQGFGEILHTLAIAGWGLLWLAPYHLLPIALDSTGWRTLLRKRAPKVRLPYLIWAAAVRDATNSLLPIFGPGGAVVGIRLLMVREVTGSAAAASVIVEGTVTLISQFLFLATGLALFFSRHVGTSDHGLEEAVTGLLVAVPFIVLVIALQSHAGLFRRLESVTDRLADRLNLPGLAGSPARLHQELRLVYAQRAVVIRSGLWQLAGLFAGAGEVWLALYLFDHPVSVGSAILLESLGQAARTAAFVIPAGIGVQEASFVVFGHLVGLSGEVGLAVALAKRFRELVFGIPVLISWQWMEGRRLVARRTLDGQS